MHHYRRTAVSSRTYFLLRAATHPGRYLDAMAPGTSSGLAALRPSGPALNTQPPPRSTRTNARPVLPVESAPSTNTLARETYASACFRAQRPAWPRSHESVNAGQDIVTSAPCSISSQRTAWSKGTGQGTGHSAASYLFPGVKPGNGTSGFRASSAGAARVLPRVVRALAEIQTDPKAARKGSLVEFEKERGKAVVGVVVGNQGKKNLLIVDQFGSSHSVKPQQISFAVLPQRKTSSPASGQSQPASSDTEPSGFTPADIVGFLSSAAKLMDASLVQLAWEEALAAGMREFSLAQLADMLMGKVGPTECYACHRLLASDQVYFRQKKTASVAYEPRPEEQVTSLRVKAQLELEARERAMQFAAKCRSAVKADWAQKPTPESWKADEYAAPRMEALTAWALERPMVNETLAKEVLAATGTRQDLESALELLTSLGVLPQHVNTALIQGNLPISFLPQVTKAAEATAASPPPDPDRDSRRDLRHLKVYMIDSADTVEVDDGLSAEVLEGGRTKIWVHVADPTRWVPLGSTLDISARARGTSVYLPNAIIPMIPFPLAAGPMSLHYGRQNTSSSSTVDRKDSSNSNSRSNSNSTGFEGIGRSSASEEDWTEALSSTASDGSADSLLTSSSEGSEEASAGEDELSRQCAMSIGVVLREGGSVEEYEIVPSYITPTYRLTFDDVIEMMSVAGAEEAEMALLVQAAQRRTQWRREQGSLEMSMPEADVKVKHADRPEPHISLTVTDQASVARMLVSEMMVLCGEVVADFGEKHKIPLPYRGQQAAEISREADEMLKGMRGLSLAAHLRTCMTRSSTNCSAPIPHAALGLPGYVQFSSPIRRYGDLLAHHQVKAVLRGHPPPLGVGQLEKLMLNVGNCQRSAGKVEGWTKKYWVLEYLRRMPAGTALTAVMLRWIKEGADALALIHLAEVGFETAMRVTRKMRFGEEFQVVVTEVNPRKGVLRLAETTGGSSQATDLFFESGFVEDEGAKDPSGRGREVGTAGVRDPSVKTLKASGGKEEGERLQVEQVC